MKFIIFFIFLFFKIFAKDFITGDNVRLRETPNGKVIANLNKYETIQILEKSKDKSIINNISEYWFKVNTNSNKVGWVFGYYISSKETNKIGILKNPRKVEIDNLANTEIIAEIQLGSNLYYIITGYGCNNCDDDKHISLVDSKKLSTIDDGLSPFYPGKVTELDGKQIRFQIFAYFGEIENDIYGLVVNHVNSNSNYKSYLYKINKDKIVFETKNSKIEINKKNNLLEIPGQNRAGSP